jgi:3-oxo-5alpha-steroid 4-dehydrogenase
MPATSKTRPTRPRKLRDVAHWDIETDVAIIGFGGAGACAAIEAHDQGAEAVIFELASASGGSTALSSAEVYLGGSGGTRVQRACGFDDSTDNMANFLMACQGEQADEAKIRAYAEGALDHFNWLVECGVPFKDSWLDERAIYAHTDDCLLFTDSQKAWPFSRDTQPVPRGHNLYVKGDNGGPLFMKVMTDNVERRGIRVVYESRALTLIVDDQHQVQGIVVRIDQREHCVRARSGVVLCAGGFNMNAPMVKKYAPFLTRANLPIGNPGDTGSGILMGLGVGAAAINMHEGFVTLPFYPPASLTYGILVNDKGQRFVNEDCYHGRVGYACLNQPGERIYMVLTVEDYGDYEKRGLMCAAVAGTGETLQELEQELELPEGALAHTVEYYNRHAAHGDDPLFHKAAAWLKPLTLPLVALDCTPGRGALYPFFTLGGLDTLPSGEVLTPEGEIIAGLYAAGRTACGVPRRADGYGSGMSVGDATFSGRKAGAAAAANLVAANNH